MQEQNECPEAGQDDCRFDCGPQEAEVEPGIVAGGGAVAAEPPRGVNAGGCE